MCPRSNPIHERGAHLTDSTAAGHAHRHGTHRHDHAGHAHGISRADAPDRAFALGAALNVTFIVIEVIFGLRARSLALLSDAGHNLGDVLGLALAWGAVVLGRARPTARRTYGLRSSSILAALANAVVLLVTVGAIAAEAVGRLRHPAPVASGTVITVAAIGVVINFATALLFVRGRLRDLNIRGAYLHMLGDAGVSAGVVIAGAAIAFTGYTWIDPAVSLAIVLVITVGTWGLLRDSLDLALHAVPASVDARAVEEYLRSLPGVADMHDLHIWGMSTTDVALTVHLVCPGVDDCDELLHGTCHTLHERFGIGHATIQIERASGLTECHLAPADVV